MAKLDHAATTKILLSELHFRGHALTDEQHELLAHVLDLPSYPMHEGSMAKPHGPVKVYRVAGQHTLIALATKTTKEAEHGLVSAHVPALDSASLKYLYPALKILQDLRDEGLLPPNPLPAAL